MTEDRARFEAATQTALRARDTAEIDLVTELVGNIRRDPGAFDPARLRHLGPEGLKALLGSVEAAADNDPGPPSTPAQPADRSVSGWARLRRPELPLWRLEVTIGILLGLAVFVFGVPLLRLLP